MQCALNVIDISENQLTTYVLPLMPIYNHYSLPKAISINKSKFQNKNMLPIVLALYNKFADFN